MTQRLLLFTLCLNWLGLFGQTARVQQLTEKLKMSSTDAEKINALNDLAEYYFVFKLDKKADSVLKSELMVAELSNNKDLVFQVLFSNAITNIGSWTSSGTFNRTLTFLETGLQYAQESGRQDYQAIAYIRKASLFKKKKEYDKAIEQATLAFSALGNKTTFDSLKSSLYLELGDIFLGKGDAVSAYRNYNNAFDIAYTIKNVPLQSEAYHRFSTLYQAMNSTDLAKQNLLKSLELNKSKNYQKGLLKDYFDLARITDEKEYIVKTGQLAQSLNSYVYVLGAERLMLAYLMVIEKDSRTALDYLNANEDLKAYFLNQGSSNYYWNLGAIYKYADKADSALYYYKLAEPEFARIYDKGVLQTIYHDMADCYTLTNLTDSAIIFFERSLSISKELNNLKENVIIASKLSQLYAQKGNYEKAFNYSRQFQGYQDTLQKMVAQRDVTRLEMERETLKREKDLEEQAQLQLNRRNLQYMSISIAIVVLFFLMIFIGAFPVSKLTIKLLGYISFICLFEFIVLLLDAFLHKLTHGEPLRIWLAKIFIIAILVPFQHFLEHGLIKFLQSQKLIKMRSQVSIKKWLTHIKTSMKKPPSSEEAGIEEDTAVL